MDERAALKVLCDLWLHVDTSLKYGTEEYLTLTDDASPMVCFRLFDALIKSLAEQCGIEFVPVDEADK